MTDIPATLDEPPVDERDPTPETPAEPGVLSFPDALRAIGFDPATVQAVILTPTSAHAISIDYPEPYTPPEATDGE